ncbi:MAG: penicillin acylase family protein [Verrucomicrobia subdivision 3 bacterium]|nr:penicillin acylase family protein [Limisphaerales bacterium]
MLAPLDGDMRVPGLREPVEVLRDRWGVPHIYAKNPGDLFFAQGFVAAQDRLFQLEWWRRHSAGALAEVLGPSALPSDRFARLMRYRGDMKAEWDSYAPDTKQIATAFTSGINAWIDHCGKNLPIEFEILKFTPKKWRPEDILGRMSGIYMSQNFKNEITRARLIQAVGVSNANALAPVDPPRDYAPAKGLELAGIDARILADFEAATKFLQYQPAKTESNNWVVAGSRSASGKPLLASDPHRAIALPSLRYLVHLNAPDWNVIGAGEPALPGVALGHNEHIAWGITIVGADQADIYVEEVNPKNTDEYRVGDGWQKFTIERHTIRVKDDQPVEIELRYTRNGPVLFYDKAKNRAYALRWVGHEPGGAAYLASLAVDRARNKEEFLKALDRWKIPGLNFVYADVTGEIGWIARAKVPIRPSHDGLLPVPGGGGFDWQGYLSIDQLPQRWNPPSGFEATANHNILPKGYKHQIGYEFAAPFRFLRVEAELKKRDKHTLEDFRAIQHDDVSLPGLALVRMLKDVEIADRRLFAHLDLLGKWDGRLSVDSRAGPLYAVWLKELQEAFYDKVPKDLRKSFMSIASLPAMIEALEKPSPGRFGSEAGWARDKLVLDALLQAVQKSAKLPDRWGALHTVTFRHPLGKTEATIAKTWNVGPFERSGDANTPNNTRFDEDYQQIHGATYRQLFDLADWDRGLATSAPGQSGQPGSPFYSNLAPLWAKGEYFPFVYSRKKVEEVTAHRLRLTPD